jgi:molybdopterin converting factor small subunit
MPVHVLIPGPLQPFADGRGRIALVPPPATVAEALDLVAALHPGVRDRVLTEQGEVRPHIAIFVGGRDIRDGLGLSTRVPEGSEIAILPAVSGG